jgi:hypothetical protein
MMKSVSGKIQVVSGISAAILVTAAAVIVPRAAAVRSTGGVREIRLVARDMAFYADGGNEPNPVLRVGRGERVRIVLRNDDPGMSHDFAVRAWSAATARIEYEGEAAVELRAPDAAGVESYGCTPHGEMMRGTLRVE